MIGPGQSGYGDDSGPLVRRYVTARGRRSRPFRDVLDVMALVAADSAPERDSRLRPEQAEVLQLCRDSKLSVAEIAARLDLPLRVVRLLLADLLAAGHIRVDQPTAPRDVPTADFLREVINGLREI